MADKRISQLNPHTSPSDSDLLVIVNNNETKKITYADLKDSIVINSDNTILNEFSASYLIDSASFDERIIAATNEQSFNGLISGSSQLTSSYDGRYVLSGSLTQTTWDNISGKPEGLVSESTDLTLLNSFTQSIDGRVSILEELTSSYETTGRGILSGSISYNSLTDIPNGIVSQSVDIADFVFTTDTITNSSITLHATDSDIILNADGNVYKGSASAGNGLVTDGYLGVIIGDENRINTGTGHSITDNLDGVTNYINQFTQSYQTDSSSFDSKILTEKGRIDAILSASTADKDSFAEIVTLINSVDLTNDIAFASYYTSSNARISSLESNTGSYETTGRGIISSSIQITPLLPIGIVSGSSQVLGGSGVYSSSAQLPNGLVSGSSQLTSSYDSRYVLSGSITQTTWDNIANKPNGIVSSSTQLTESFETTGRGIISSSQQTTSWGYATTSSLNSFTASYTTDSSSFNSSINAIMALSSSTQLSDLIRNGETTTLVKGTPVYVSGSQGSNPIVYRADASNPNKMPVTYIVDGNIATNQVGNGVILGHIEGVDLTGYNEGISVYVAEGGGWSINPPSGSNSIKQLLGIVTKTGSGGKGMVLNPGPATLPNLQTGYIWVGNTNNQAATMMTASFVFTSSYNSDSSSFDSRITSLVSAGVPAGTISGSSQLTASFDTRYTLSGSVQSVTLPTGLISSSEQLPNGLISSSAQITGFETIGRNIISSSTQITAYGFISQSTDLSSLNSFTSSYFTDSSSLNTKVTDLINHTSSYEPTGRGIISESVVTISGTTPSVGVGNLWYDSNEGNLYLHYDTNTWVDTSNGVIQTIISDGSLLSTASFNAWTASYTASVPNGTISSSAQITSFGFVSGSYETTGRGIISSSTQLSALGYVTSGGNVTFNSVTANQYIVSSSVYYVTASYSSGSTISGNSGDDTHQFTGSVSISGSLTSSLTNGYFWVGNSSNRTYEVPTSSFVSTTTFNALSQSANTTDIQVSGSIASLQASLGSTSNAFTYTSVTNPTAYVLVSYLTSSFNGGTIDILMVNTSNSTATSANYQFASFGSTAGISQNGKQTSGAGGPSPAMSMTISGSYMTIRVTETGTFNIKGVARLF